MNDLKRLRKEHAKMGKTIARLEEEKCGLTFADLSVADRFIDVDTVQSCPSIKISFDREVYWNDGRLVLMYVRPSLMSKKVVRN